jgi:hypothetical protein
MALSKMAYFDERGHFFRTPDEATLSDIAALLGRVGEGDSIAPGIAKTLFEKRGDLERIFAAHDAIIGPAGHDRAASAGRLRQVA